jgi:hypothetical protein
LPNSLAQTIHRMLSDAMGNFIATATLKKNCELIGTTAEDLSAEHLPALAQKIEKSVAFFKDEDTGRELAQKIKELG